MSSRQRLCVMRPGGRLVVEGAGLGTAVEDADQAVGELAQGGVVACAAGSLPVVAGACAGRKPQGGECLGEEGIDEPVVVDEPGQRDLLLAGRAGDWGGPGVVLAGLSGGVPAGGVAGLCEHPGAEGWPQPWLRMISAAGCCPKWASTCPCMVLTWVFSTVRTAIRAWTDAA